MAQYLKIAIVGDFNFAYTSHHATNKALQHVEVCLEQPLNYYWINSKEITSFNMEELSQFDGFFIAPGPYQNAFYIANFIGKLQHLNTPTMITGEGFKLFVEDYIRSQKLNLSDDNYISKNQVTDNKFVATSLVLLSKKAKNLLENTGKKELTSSKYSIVPEVWENMKADGWDILAENTHEDPEIIEKSEPCYFMATMFCPQVNSSSDLPHPLLINFIKEVKKHVDETTKD